MQDDTIARWQQGYGVVTHTQETQLRINAMLKELSAQSIIGDGVEPYSLLAAADRLTNAAIWLAVHQTYAKHVYLDGRKLTSEDFKADPQGHLGGSLNMVPAYAGYLLANALTGFTRSWVMEQGHAVAAIDSLNLLVNNMTQAHADRYDVSDEGLSRFAQDFYSYQLDEAGKQVSPLGSHVNPHTAGGHMEGGYLGFASVQYAHMPLPGERLVAFLSDGAFEEQRGADWTARWWRAEDSGLVAPIMIANGRRIDQRTTLEQEGGIEFFEAHLRLHGFDPIVFDGRDPAAFAWAILEQEKRLQDSVSQLHSVDHYKISIPYGIAVAPKGAGFYNEGTNYAHNLPLVENPHNNEIAASRFNSHASKCFVPLDQLQEAIGYFQHHAKSGRVQEKNHPLANRQISLKQVCTLPSLEVPAKRDTTISPMDAIDAAFLGTVKANPHLRSRVGNPDEMLSNRMDDTLEALEFRVVEAEEGAEESTLGNVITALNEEAVAGAAFGNKGGINLVVTYEAFGAKMFGEARQEVIFAKHQQEIGKPAGWLSVPIILTSNSWENSKNELSHQDSSMAESMLSETSDISRVVFPADYNSALSVMKHIYQTNGEVWTVVVPKRSTPLMLNEEESERLLDKGAIELNWAGHNHDNASHAIIAIGAYQLIEVLKASEKLAAEGKAHRVYYMIEPGRFRHARNEGEAAHCVKDTLLPDSITSLVFVTHTRPELMIGTLRPLWENGRTVKALGFINQGGTLDVAGMLTVNKCSWQDIVNVIQG